MKRLAMLLLALLPLQGFGQRTAIELPPPDRQLCGRLTSQDGENFSLEVAESGVRLALTGTERIVEGFREVYETWHGRMSICMPCENPAAIDPKVPLEVEWFFYVNPAASGVSVVSQEPLN